jgi:hypothetical protein
MPAAAWARTRRARQSDALHRPGGGGAARCAAGVRQRLPRPTAPACATTSM